MDTEWDVDSIREEWTANSVRLPDSVQKPFDSQHKRLDWELEQSEQDVAFTKDRYYKPLVVALGVRQLEELGADDVASLLDDLERGELFDG